MYSRFASHRLLKRKYMYNGAINTQNRTYTEFTLADMSPNIFVKLVSYYVSIRTCISYLDLDNRPNVNMHLTD